MPIPTLHIDDEALGQPREPVPLRLACLITGPTCDEDRWITLGRAENGQLIVVVHTWISTEPTEFRARIISARQADTYEARDYQDLTR